MNEKIRPGLRSIVRGLVTGQPAELVERQKLGRPIQLPWVERDQQGDFSINGQPVSATPVGDERRVTHPTFHDMGSHAVDMDVTAAVLEHGLEANAVWVDPAKFRRTSTVTAVTVYQPLQITAA